MNTDFDQYRSNFNIELLSSPSSITATNLALDMAKPSQQDVNITTIVQQTNVLATPLPAPTPKCRGTHTIPSAIKDKKMLTQMADQGLRRHSEAKEGHSLSETRGHSHQSLGQAKHKGNHPSTQVCASWSWPREEFGAGVDGSSTIGYHHDRENYRLCQFLSSIVLTVLPPNVPSIPPTTTQTIPPRSDTATNLAKPFTLQDLGFPPSDDEAEDSMDLEGINLDDIDPDSGDEDLLDDQKAGKQTSLGLRFLKY
jgi:hypothetical protein